MKYALMKVVNKPHTCNLRKRAQQRETDYSQSLLNQEVIRKKHTAVS
jgi:hypothetical protein